MPISWIALVLALGAAVQTDNPIDEARGLFEQSRLTEATRLLDDILDNGAGDERAARLLLADVLVADGRADQAVEVLLALKSDEDYEVSLALGRTHVAWSQQLAEAGARDDDVRVVRLDAQTMFQRAVSLAPAGNTDATVALGYLTLYQLGDHETVLTLADEALREHPDDGELILLRGCAGVYDYWTALQAGDTERASQAWQRSVDDLLAADQRLGPERTEAWGQLIWLYENDNRPEEAVDAAIAVVDRQEDPAFDSLYRLAVKYSYARQFQAASKALEKIVSVSAREITNRLRREQDTTAVATELSWSVGPFVQRNDNATARTVLAAITAAGPENPVIWDNYAVTCQATSRFEDAVKAYERRLQIDDTDPRTYNDLAAILQYDLKRDLDKARNLYGKCIALADAELATQELDGARRSHVEEAKRLAQSNLDGTNPRRGVLDSVLKGLRNIKIPKVPSAGQGDEGNTGSEDDTRK